MAEAIDSGAVLLTAGAGYGKTTVLDQALSNTTRPVAWISCSDTDRAPETLLIRILDAISRAAPGATDALTERLAASAEQVDVTAATHELLADLPRLLVEPLVLVVDDAEHLDEADSSLLLLSELISSELAGLRVAVASRSSLDLRVAKARAASRVTELTSVDLAFDHEECTALLSSRSGREPAPDEVAEVMEATEGWPLGIALAVARVEEGRRGSANSLELGDLRSAPEVRAFLSEELLDALDPDLRRAVIRSSVARVVSPEVARALDLPEGFGDRIERAGVLMRHPEDGEGFAYHPLLRDVLLELLGAELGDEERRRLHATVAPAIADAGDPVEATEHWLEAQRWPEAIASIEREGPTLIRTATPLMSRWLSLLPAEARELPTIRSLEGQLEWAAGNHPRAAETLREAIIGFRDRPNPPAEWLARFQLADSLFSTGEFDQIVELADGWDRPEAEAAGVLAPATAIYVALGFALIGRFEESDQLAEEALRHPDAALLRPVEALRQSFRDVPAGHLDQAIARMEGAFKELERFDPFNRRLYFLATLAQMYAERGRMEESLATWMRVRETARGGGGPFLADTTHAWTAVLLTKLGRLEEAETELAKYRGEEKSWLTCIGDLARVGIASRRGDVPETVANADRALAVAAPGPVVYTQRTAAQLVPDLVRVGRADRAEEIIDETLERVDEIYPGPLGCFLRGRLLALRAWLRHTVGDAEGADADLRLFWKEAGESVPDTLRREWRRLEVVIWDALERGVLEPAPTIEAIAEGSPEGIQLVPFLEHPLVAVRRAALKPATESGHPAALEHLQRLAEDPDSDLAAAASRAVGRLARTMPPLRFELLGGFAAARGSWRADDAWGRPVDARLVRFLLVHVDEPVPEDLILDALWPELSPSGARKSLQTAASRLRRVLDPPGAEQSMIQSAERSYRLVLGNRDLVDAEEFRSAAEVALAERGEERRALLDRARFLWGGEPLPEERYADWATAYRERLIDRYTEVLAALVEIHAAAGEHTQAADVARELVDLDSLNEGGHRALIVAYARAGRTGHALRQYLECRRALIEELGIEPSAATSELQARVLAGLAV